MDLLIPILHSGFMKCFLAFVHCCPNQVGRLFVFASKCVALITLPKLLSAFDVIIKFRFSTIISIFFSLKTSLFYNAFIFS